MKSEFNVIESIIHRFRDGSTIPRQDCLPNDLMCMPEYCADQYRRFVERMRSRVRVAANVDILRELLPMAHADAVGLVQFRLCSNAVKEAR